MPRHSNKFMKNTSYCITPNNKAVELVLRNAQLLNEFYALGFKTRASFIEIMQTHFYKYKGYRDYKKLIHFYILRNRDEQMLIDVETVLNLLKNE